PCCPPALSSLLPYTTLFRSQLNLPCGRHRPGGSCRRTSRSAVVPPSTRVSVTAPGALCIDHQAQDERQRTHHDQDDAQRCVAQVDRKSTRLNSSHVSISYAV